MTTWIDGPAPETPDEHDDASRDDRENVVPLLGRPRILPHHPSVWRPGAEPPGATGAYDGTLAPVVPLRRPAGRVDRPAG